MRQLRLHLLQLYDSFVGAILFQGKSCRAQDLIKTYLPAPPHCTIEDNVSHNGDKTLEICKEWDIL